MSARREMTWTMAAAAVTVTALLVAAGAIGWELVGQSDEAAASVEPIDGDQRQVVTGGVDGSREGAADTTGLGGIDVDPADLPEDAVIVPVDAPVDLVITDTELDVVVDDDGELAPGTSGVGTLQLPTAGPLATALLDRPLRGVFGVAYGRDLAHLGAHLRDDQRYLYSDLGTQPFELFLDLDDAHDGAGGLPDRISTDGSSGPSMFVAALDGDYFYVSTPCPAMVPAESGSSQRPSQQRDSDYAEASASEIPGVSLDLSSFDPGGCGIGWSIAGQVPFTPILGDRGITIPSDFGAHVVVDGTVPVHPSATLDGELFYRFDDEGAAVWANGELDVGVAFLKGAAEVTLPAVQGTFGLQVTPTRFDMAVTATAGSSASDGAPSQLLADLAPVQGRVDVDGQLTIEDGVVLDSSFFELSGDISISPAPVRTASSVDVDDVFSADGLVRIDTSGVLASGSVQSSPLSDLAVTGEAEMSFFVPFADASSAYLEVSGSLGLGETALGADALLRIDRDGALAKGSIDLAGFGGLDVEGTLGVNGFQLTGAADAVLPIGDLDQVAANLVDQTDNRQVIQALNAQIDERIDEIAASNPSKGAELRTTVGDMRQAFEDIAAVRDTIAYNDGLIAQLWRDHQADIDWHWALNDFDRFWDKGPHAARLGAILVEIEALKAANTVQYGYIDVANLTISGTQQLVIGIIGWDEELNALLALQTEAYLGTLVGNVVATVLNGADAILDSFGVDGSAVGTVTFTVGTEAIGASASLEWCRDGVCSVLAGATVNLTPTVEVCATMLGVPACAAL